MAVFFIVGEMAGTGIVNLPQAISQTGWIGCGFLILCACMASFTGTKLGRSHHRPLLASFPARSTKPHDSNFKANVGILLFKKNRGIKKIILLLIRRLPRKLLVDWDEFWSIVLYMSRYLWHVS